MKKRLLACILAIATLLSLTACGSSSGSSGSSGGSTDASYELKFASQDAEGLPSTEAMHWIADEIASRTDGHVTLKIYPSNQLGEAKLLYEGIMDGSIDMYLGYLDPTYNIAFDLTTIPFLASSYDQIAYICSKDSNCYKIQESACEESEMVFLGFFLNGVNGIFSTVDLGNYMDPSVKKSTLVRIANSVTYDLGISGLGYSTITIPWSDTYTSMQTGVFDAMTGIPSYMVEQNFGDLTKYYLPIDMYMETNSILMSPATKDKLPAEYYEIIQQVCDEAAENSISTTKENVDAGIDALAARGVTILPITDAERAEVGRKVLESIRPQLEDYFGSELIAQAYEDVENAGA